MPITPRLLLVAALFLLPVALAQAGAAAPPTAPINDTGQDWCVKPHLGMTHDCTGTGQDGEFGRDATAHGPANGHAGFSFVKLDAAGKRLPPDAASWPCVLDKVTGLVWENKTHDGGLHDGSAVFTHLGNGQPDDASGHVAAVNAEGLCGAHDWRLPNRREMEGLLDYSRPEGAPLIASDWFPDTAGIYWTSNRADQLGGGPHYRWAVVYASGRTFWQSGRFNHFAVRLVRQGQALGAGRFLPAGAEVYDRSTNLIWRRCAEGQTWSGSACTGAPTVFLTAPDALDHTKSVADATGLGWREPNVKELSSLVDTSVNGPAIDRAAFPGFVCGSCYSGTRWAENTVYSWRVDFAQGVIGVNFWGRQPGAGARRRLSRSAPPRLTCRRPRRGPSA